jgi:hypothetical protein
VALLILLISDQLFGQVLQGPIVNPSNGYSYFLLQNATWDNSQSEALSLGGNLATVNSAAENTWIFNTFALTAADNGADLWIGLYDPDKGDGTGAQHAADFIWIDGEAVTYTNWAPGEPNDNPQEGGAYFAALTAYAHDGLVPGDWNDKKDDSQGVPSMGVVEVMPEPASLAWLTSSAMLVLRRRRK